MASEVDVRRFRRIRCGQSDAVTRWIGFVFHLQKTQAWRQQEPTSSTRMHVRFLGSNRRLRQSPFAGFTASRLSCREMGSYASPRHHQGAISPSPDVQ